MKGPLSQLFSVLFVGAFVLQGCSSNSKDRGDVRPDEFTVTSTQTEVEPNTLVESQPFTVTGINREAKVTLSSDEIADLKFTVNGGEPKESGSTVRNGDEVVVLGTSPSAYGANASINVNIGGVESEFAVSTGDDETPPEVSILFPPPSSMTEGETVFVRGTVEDLYGEVSTLLVNGVEVDITDGLPEWSVNVPVNVGENTLTVTATDVSGNENNDHSVNVRRDPDGGAFPDNENPSVLIGYSGGIGVYQGRQSLFVPDFDGEQVFVIDLSTGSRHVLFKDSASESQPFDALRYLTVGEDRIYASDINAVFEIDFDGSEKRVLVSNTSFEALNEPRGIAFANLIEGEQLFFSDENKIYTVDLESGETDLFLDGSQVGDGLVGFGDVRSLAFRSAELSELYVLTESDLYIFDAAVGDLLFSANLGEQYFFWDLSVTEDGSIYLVDSEIPTVLRATSSSLADVAPLMGETAENMFDTPSGIACLDELGFCTLVDPYSNSVLALDRSTGHRVVLTRSVQE